MVETISNHKSDMCKQNCQWPTYHKDLVELIASGKYRGLIIVENCKEERQENITRYFEKKNKVQSDQPQPNVQTIVDLSRRV